MWFYKGKEFDKDVRDFDSFVYIITRLKDDEDYPKYYIGKKTFWFKGRKESDWLDYYGSSKDLNILIKEEGVEFYRRDILHLCNSKGESFILEAKEQLKNNVLSKKFKNGVKMFWNKHILGNYTKEYFTEDEIEQLQSTNNTMNTTNKVWITNGHESKLIRKDELIPEGWDYGNHYSSGILWINNGKEEKKISLLESECIEYRYWNKGRLEAKNKNKICINRGDELKYISENDIKYYINKGWVLGNNKIKSLDERNKIYVCNDSTKEQKLINRNDIKSFLNDNKDWRIGQFKRIGFTTSKLVPAIDIETNEKVMIPVEEYKNNDKYIARKTKKIKVKKNNRIIYKGYITKFFQESKLPENPFRTTLRNGGGDVIITKGKYKWITNEKYHIVYL